MVRRKQKSDPYMTSVCMTLPHDVVVILDACKKQTGNNRSAAAAFIIRDWKRGIRGEADLEREKMRKILEEVLGRPV
jgi:hypothetical protein